MSEDLEISVRFIKERGFIISRRTKRKWWLSWNFFGLCWFFLKTLQCQSTRSSVSVCWRAAQSCMVFWWIRISLWVIVYEVWLLTNCSDAFLMPFFKGSGFSMSFQGQSWHVKICRKTSLAGLYLPLLMYAFWNRLAFAKYMSDLIGGTSEDFSLWSHLCLSCILVLLSPAGVEPFRRSVWAPATGPNGNFTCLRLSFWGQNTYFRFCD